MKASSLSINLSLVAFYLIAAVHGQGVRGNTYCEILWAKSSQGIPDNFTISWNGFGGTCPTNPGYFNVTEQDVRDVHGNDTSFVFFNGIRQWVATSAPLDNPNNGPIEAYRYGKNIFPNGSGLFMIKAGEADFSTVSVNTGPFSAFRVARSAVLSWEAGEPVYELIAPNCSAIFVMQSIYLGSPGAWGLQGGEDDLPSLVEQGLMTLPEGWTYRTRILEQTMTVFGENNAVVVMSDPLRNTYSKIDDPVDPSLCPGFEIEVDFSLPKRGDTYCEVLWAKPEPSSPIPSTVTTDWHGFNGTCPTVPGYYNITEQDVRDVHGEDLAIIQFNGITQLLANSNARAELDASSVNFVEYGSNIFPDGSGLAMISVATVALKLPPETIGDGAFVVTQVNRNTTLSWEAGKPVYELIAPNCEDIYVMQDFRIGRPGDWGVASEAELAVLAESGRLTLPDGWTYRTRVLEEELFVFGDGIGEVTVLLDNYRNHYTRVNKPFDQSLCPDDTASTPIDPESPPSVEGSGRVFCEILWGRPNPISPFPLTLTVGVNTTLEDCFSGFYNLTEQDIRDVQGAGTIVAWNGARQALVVTEERVPGNTRELWEYGTGLYPDGSGFQVVFNGNVTIESQPSSDGSYVPNKVDRPIILTWEGGKPVYELVTPNCEAIYIMQNFYIGRPGDWGIRGGQAALPTLVEDGVISLPEGWTYRTRMLQENLTVYGESDGRVLVLQDDARNAYSKMDAGFDQLLCPSMSVPEVPRGRGRIGCEILWGHPTPGTGFPINLTISINGTSSECVGGYYNVTEQDVKDVHGQDIIVVWNGGRLALMTSEPTVPIEGRATYEYGKDIYPDGSGFLMMENGYVTITGQRPPYSANPVNRLIRLTWPAGYPVYELVAPDCEAVYIMQSAYVGRPGDWGVSGEEALPTLVEDGVISPPDGWLYRTRVLDANLTVYGESDGSVLVLQDDARNSYSKLDGDFDRSICPMEDSMNNTTNETSLSNSTVVDIRGNQYCEILWGAPTPPGIVPFNLTVVWNGTGGHCPTNPGFFNITDDDVKAVHGPSAASFIVYNGVRQMLVSSQGRRATGLAPQPYMYGRDIFPDGSGMIMIRVAVQTVENAVGDGPYTPNPVNRPSVLLWTAGDMVYELVAPNCSAIYMMQSFYIGRPGHWGVQGGEQELATIGENGRLKLPEGWTYRARVLEDNIAVFGEPDGRVMVLTDNLQNTYSKMDGEEVDPSLCPGHTVVPPATEAPVTTSKSPTVLSSPASPTVAPTTIATPTSSSSSGCLAVSVINLLGFSITSAFLTLLLLWP